MDATLLCAPQRPVHSELEVRTTEAYISALPDAYRPPAAAQYFATKLR